MDDSQKTIVLSGREKTRELKSLALQSPLSGVSDVVFRQLVRKWAPDSLLFTEMINAFSLKQGYGECKVQDLREESGPIGVQLFDNRPEAIVQAAQFAEECGAFLIDINMGCPVKKIARKGGGSALLRDPLLAEKIVSETVNAVKIPVTVKTRLGWCEKSCDAIGFARRLEGAGAQLITLHGRTRKQGFSGKANWEDIAKVKKALKIPLIANGDINDVHQAKRCLDITKANGVMIGRGSMGAPWLVGQINCALQGKPIFSTPKAKERISLSLEHLQKLLEYYGDHGLLIARKHMSWTCKGFSRAGELRRSLVRAKSPNEAINLLEEELSLY
tara:strand:- start:47 stop:1039 length:993 start_codon:yes stop_codon:yes gene_type:complete